MLLDRNHENGQGDLEPNMTPLIDVSLVLVVILLLTPLALESGILFDRGDPLQTAQAALQERPLLDLRLVSEETVEVEGKLIPRESLLGFLTPRMRQQKYRGVAIDCAGWVTHGAFVNVLDQARLSGAQEIAVAGQ